jgi:hypothetical protein
MFGIMNFKYGPVFISAMLAFVLHAKCYSYISLHKGHIQVQMSKLTLLRSPFWPIFNSGL